MSELKLVNPYKDVEKTRMTCTSITVADADRAFLLAIYPEPSALQVSLNIILVKLVEALKAKGMTTYNPDEYVKLMDRVRLSFAEEPGEEAVTQHKKRREAVKV